MSKRKQTPITEDPDVQRLIKQMVSLQATNKALMKACEGAMRISKLWRVGPEINLENPSEGQALDVMGQQIEAALALAKKGE